MKHKRIASLTALFVAATLVVLSLNYSSPTATRTINSKGLHLLAPSCSTMITLPLVGVSYTKPDSIIFQVSVRAPSPHAAPSCSVFGRGTYGSFITTDWTPWTFMFAVDSGNSWNEVGRPWSSYDFLWLKFKLSGSDTAVVNATLKYLGDLAQSGTVTYAPPFLERTIAVPCTLDNNTDFYLIHSTKPGVCWLPLASKRSRPIFIFCDVLPLTPIALACQSGDSMACGTTSASGAFTHAGDGRIAVSDGTRKWCFTSVNF
jgi:hypothetical protein